MAYRNPIASLRAFAHEVGLLPRFLAMEGVLLALLFAASLILVGRLSASLEASQATEWSILAKSTALAIDGTLADASGSLKDSAAWYQGADVSGSAEAAQAVLDLTAQNTPIFTNGILVVGPDRRVRAADRRHRSILGADLHGAWSAAGSAARTVDGVAVWGWSDATSRDGTIVLAVALGPSEGGEEVVGLIGVGPSGIDRLLSSAVRLGQSGHAELVDQDCRVTFATEPSPFLGTGEHPSFCRARFAIGGAGIGEAATEVPETGDLQGPHLMAFVPLQTLPWALEIGTSTAEAYGPADQLYRWSIAALAAFTLLTFLATTFVVRKVVEPVTTLSGQAQRIASGAPTGRLEIAWGGEIGELARSLETMRRRFADWAATLEEQVDQRTAELEERHRELTGLYASLRRQEVQRQELLGRILTAQEDERHRVSRELHDSIGQAFWALTLHLERLQGLEGCPSSLRAELRNLQALAAESLSDLRRLTVALRPAALDDLGLVPAIRRYAELYLGDAGIPFDIADDGLGRRLDPFRETVVYRVVQEAINNVARHSGAKQAHIALQQDEDALVAIVADDGHGFDRRMREPGVGLQGMAERALLVGGHLEVESAPGKGTIVRLKVPIGTPPLGVSDEPKDVAAG